MRPPIFRTATFFTIAFLCVLLAACGGGGGGSSSTPAPPVPPVILPPVVIGGTNQVPLVIGPGPLDASGQQIPVVNIPYVSVTVCRPGSTTQCQTINQIQVDTGSSGLRILASAVSPALGLPATTATTGNPLAECVQFADGYSFGAVRQADIYLGGEAARTQSVQIVSDSAFPNVPLSCSSGLPARDTVNAYGANGVIGISAFRQDCGNACVISAIPGTYYTCTSSSCSAIRVPLASQVSNPIASFAVNNNGSSITLPSVPANGATGATGTLTFGIATQANNTLGTAQILTLDNNRVLTTVYNGRAFDGFFDSGSNGFFFFDNSIPECSTAPGFFCPLTTLNLTATNIGINGNSNVVNFSIVNIGALFTANPSFTAYQNIGGSLAGLFGVADAFDWGLPFFYGRRVFTSLEGVTINGAPGPFIAY
ncbi:MAG: DUF3443 domain-containing protein [Burkholderiaceae bacterium]